MKRLLFTLLLVLFSITPAVLYNCEIIDPELIIECPEVLYQPPITPCVLITEELPHYEGLPLPKDPTLHKPPLIFTVLNN